MGGTGPTVEMRRESEVQKNHKIKTQSTNIQTYQFAQGANCSSSIDAIYSCNLPLLPRYQGMLIVNYLFRHFHSGELRMLRSVCGTHPESGFYTPSASWKISDPDFGRTRHVFRRLHKKELSVLDFCGNVWSDWSCCLGLTRDVSSNGSP